LIVNFTQRITIETGKAPISEKSPQPILLRGLLLGGLFGGIMSEEFRYTLLPCDNRLNLGVPDEAYEGAEKPNEVKIALENSLSETESLIKPVFFQDDTHTFFVEPDVVERTVEDWQTWLEPTQPSGQYEEPDWIPWLEEHVHIYFPEVWPVGPIPPVDPWVLPQKLDWLVNPATVIRFDDQPIGALGSLPLTFEQVAPESTLSGVPVDVNPASAVDTAEVAVLAGGVALDQAGLVQTAGGINVLGMGGINAGIMRNVDRLGMEGFGAGAAGILGR
jgi:hypothetical protein